MVFTVNMENLKEIIQEEEIKDTRSKLEKFEKLFDIMKDFFKKRKIVIYGGAAMNMHLPKEHKIYTDDDFQISIVFHVVLRKTKIFQICLRKITTNNRNKVCMMEHTKYMSILNPFQI